MRDEIFEKLVHAKSKIDGFGEIRFQNEEGMTIVLENGEITNVEPIFKSGGNVRILLKGHNFGFSTFSKLDDIDRAFTEAIDMSRSLIPDDEVRLAEVEPIEDFVKISINDDFREHSVDEIVNMLKEYDELIMEHSRKTIGRVLVYRDYFMEKYLVTTDNVKIFTQKILGVVDAKAISTNGEKAKTIHFSMVSFDSFAELTKKQDLFKKIASIADKLLCADYPSCKYCTIILAPKVAAIFTHEIVHFFEADNLLSKYKNDDLVKLGQKNGPGFLNIFDDGSMVPEKLGTIFYDDEGVPAKKNYLVKNGVIVNYLHSRKTAALMNGIPTGNARSPDFRYQPVVRMTNTAIESGPFPVNQMFDEIKIGVYVVDFYKFFFSNGLNGSILIDDCYGYMIRNGKLAEMVDDFSVLIDLSNGLFFIEQIGDDFMWSNSYGFCGKNGQKVLVGVGAPHVKIKNAYISRNICY